jgi:hypothetical protein
MKELITVTLVLMLIGLPLTAGAAEKIDKSRQALENGQQGSSYVSPDQKQTVSKRDAARKKRDEKIKTRNKNINKSESSTANLFGNSR